MSEYTSMVEKFKGILASDLPRYLACRNGQIGFNLPSGFVSANEIYTTMENLRNDIAIEKCLLNADIKMLQESINMISKGSVIKK